MKDYNTKNVSSYRYVFHRNMNLQTDSYLAQTSVKDRLLKVAKSEKVKILVIMHSI